MVFPRLRVAIEVIDSNLAVKLPFPDAGGERLGIAIQRFHSVEDFPAHVLGQYCPPVPVNVPHSSRGALLCRTSRPIGRVRLVALANRMLPMLTDPGATLGVVDHAEPGGAVLRIAVNFRMEAVMVS